MKICPRCKKTYEDSWKVCLKCNTGLAEVPRQDEFITAAHDEFKKIDSRLRKIEKALNIESPAPEQPHLAPAAQHITQPISQPAAGPITPSVTPAAAPDVNPPDKGDMESRIGLVWLNRIGLVALFLGAAFFLKYAFDNRWIGELGRVIIGLTAGFGMVAASEFARRKDYDVMAQGLHGGGVGILYLSIFAAFGFYHLIGIVPAFVFMALVTLYCGFWSTRTDWISSAVIGLIGGFLTPFLFGIEKISPSILFSYVILLDLGTLFISIYKKWGALNIGSFFLTLAVYISWTSASYTQDKWLFAASFVTAFFAIFCLLSIFRNLIYKEKSDRTDIILVLANGVAYFGELYFILNPFAGSLPGLLPLLLGCVYIAFSYSALTRCREDKGLVLSYVSLAVIFVTITIPIQLEHGWVTISWAIESLVLIWMGFKLNYFDIRKIGLILGTVSLLKALMIDFSYNPLIYGKNLFILNERMFVYVVVVLIIFAASLLYKKNKDIVSPAEKAMSRNMILLANFMILVQLSVEAKTYFAHIASLKAAEAPIAVTGRHMNEWRAFMTEYAKLSSARELTLSLLWVIYAFLLVAIGMYRKFRALRIMALALFGIAIFKIFLSDLSQLDRIYRIISFITLGVMLMVASFFYQKYRNEIRDFTMKD